MSRRLVIYRNYDSKRGKVIIWYKTCIVILNVPVIKPPFAEIEMRPRYLSSTDDVLGVMADLAQAARDRERMQKFADKYYPCRYGSTA